MIPQSNSNNNVAAAGGRRGNTADALNIAKMTAEERKENRMLMGQVLMQAGRGGPATLQNAAAAVLGGGGPYKNGVGMGSQPPLTEERRNHQIGMGSGLPPSGYRGQSLSYPRGGTGGQPGAFNDPFQSNSNNNHYSYHQNNNQNNGPKIATINVRVRII